MRKRTDIEWVRNSDGSQGWTWSPWVGCTKVSPACDHCYAEAWAKRAGNPELWTGDRRRTSASYWEDLIKLNAEAERLGLRFRVFPSLCDPFDNQVPARWRDDHWHYIAMTPHIDHLLLTKRPQNIRKFLPDPRTGTPEWGDGWPNVWLGTTAEDEHHYRQRWPHVAAVPAAVRFLSYEPAVGPLGDLDLGRVGAPNWVIAGGESGGNARPMHPDWVRSLRDQCVAAGVPFLFKQWGEWKPAGDWYADHPVSLVLREWRDGAWREVNPNGNDEYMARLGKKAAGRLLDGVLHDAFPAVRP